MSILEFYNRLPKTFYIKEFIRDLVIESEFSYKELVYIAHKMEMSGMMNTRIMKILLDNYEPLERYDTGVLKQLLLKMKY